jgi:hypothetical protein
MAVVHPAFAAWSMGWALLMVFGALFCATNAATDFVLACYVRAAAEEHLEDAPEVGTQGHAHVISFDALTKLYAPRLHRLAQTVVLVGSYGAAVGFMIIIGEGSGALAWHTPRACVRACVHPRQGGPLRNPPGLFVCRAHPSCACCVAR